MLRRIYNCFVKKEKCNKINFDDIYYDPHEKDKSKRQWDYDKFWEKAKIFRKHILEENYNCNCINRAHDFLFIKYNCECIRKYMSECMYYQKPNLLYYFLAMPHFDHPCFKLEDKNTEKNTEIEKYPSYIEHNDTTYFLYGGWSEIFPIIGKGINITYKNINGDSIFYSEKYTGKLMIDEKILQPIYWKYSPSIYECLCNEQPKTHPTLTSELQEKLLQEMRDVGALK